MNHKDEFGRGNVSKIHQMCQNYNSQASPSTPLSYELRKLTRENPLSFLSIEHSWS